MFDMDRMMNRIQWREQQNADGQPTGDALVSTERLHQFMRPFFSRKKCADGTHEIRLEWLGYYEEGSGTDVFKVEGELMDKVLAHFREDSNQLKMAKNVT